MLEPEVAFASLEDVVRLVHAGCFASASHLIFCVGDAWDVLLVCCLVGVAD